MNDYKLIHIKDRIKGIINKGSLKNKIPLVNKKMRIYNFCTKLGMYLNIPGLYNAKRGSGLPGSSFNGLK